MAFVNRFFLNENGGLTFTGNTLGLSRSNIVGVPGVEDAIGAFITTDTTQQFGTYPPGTVGDFRQNNSAAQLVLPQGSTILYAELIWGGTYLNGGVDFSAFINDPVNFTTPAGLISVNPDPDTAMEGFLSGSLQNNPTAVFVRSANVTSLVAAGGAGTYAAGRIVGTIIIPEPTSNNAGWTLAVYYRNPASPLRNLSLRVGINVIRATQGPVNTLINGFATPFQGPLNGRAAVSAQEGDANKTGDRAQFGPNINSLSVLSGPNNFANNFFASQINNDSGALDTTGTFGTRNQTNGQPGSNIVGGRQGWDITNVDISATLLNGQTSAQFGLITNGDGYLVNAIGLQIDIAVPLLRVTKSTNATSLVVDDVFTYTVLVENTGAVNATAVELFDNIEENTVFVPQSVVVNGTPQPLADPTLGVTLGTIPPGGTVTVSFRVRLISFPVPSEIQNQSLVSFTFQPTPDSKPISTFVPSNIITIPAFHPIVTIEKSADRTNALVGDTVTYTLIVRNTGNISTSNTVTDPLSTDVSFVPGSVTVNGTPRPADNITAGVNVGTIAPGGQVTVVFRVVITSLPASGVVRNTSVTAFTFTLPDNRTLQGNATSNEVIIPVSAPDVTVTKSASTAGTFVGDTVTYTLNVVNNNPTPVNSTVLSDAVPFGSTFIAGTVTVNGLPAPTADPSTGIQLGTIAGGVTVPVTFQVTVTTVPQPPILSNRGTVTFTSGTFTGVSVSNLVEIPVFTPALQLLKGTGTTVVSIGQTYTYSVRAQNTGDIALDVTVSDPLNPFISFVPGSVTVSGVPIPAASPLTGIPIGVLQPDDFIFVTFDVTAVSAPPTQFFENQSNASFTFQPPGGNPGSGNVLSNIVRVQNASFPINIQKTAGSIGAFVGTQVNFTIVVINTGAFPSLNTIVTDETSPGIAFVPNSVAVDGLLIPGANILEGVNVGTIPAGGQVIVTFRGTVQSVPAGNSFQTDIARVQFVEATLGPGPNPVPIPGTVRIAESTVVGVEVFIPSLTATKSALQSFAFVGDTINYATEIVNAGNLNAVSTWFDILPEGTIFVENSFALNGTPVPGANLFTGLVLGTIPANATSRVTFKFKVVSYPPTGVITNQGNMVFDFILADGSLLQQSVLTNPVTIPILALPTLTKTSNVREIGVGGVVTFSVSVTNPTVFSLDNIVVTDLLPEGFIFVTGSVVVDGVASPSANPATGIQVGSLGPRASKTVTFQARAAFEPANPVTLNVASASLNFLLPDGRRVNRTVTSDPVQVRIVDDEE
ncbi:hypothetical protein SY83_19800 [Paenibacillus swuensis]|uniref:DUF11 domain-containing protein n=1 Tax=Paenibacillus swuensis TaxID=1178515 RepID=A0A172TMF9_9BACL|nr:DUF11 domain-containing protein [Paenibacillus swuensis]ANE48162.1 hypothetical protein SY83_19800 [Paenibacillus swuensis]